MYSSRWGRFGARSSLGDLDRSSEAFTPRGCASWETRVPGISPEIESIEFQRTRKGHIICSIIWLFWKIMWGMICWVCRNCSLWTCWNCKVWRCVIFICCKSKCCWRCMSEIASSLHRTPRSSVNCWEILCGIEPGRTGDKGRGPVDLAKAQSAMATLQRKDETKLNQSNVWGRDLLRVSLRLVATWKNFAHGAAPPFACQGCHVVWSECPPWHH